jgi:hypothetical protein
VTLAELAGTKWEGDAELWLDPAGDQASRCACTLAVEAGGVGYGWSHEGQPHTGRLALREGGADFTDTFHSPSPMRFRAAPSPRGLLDLFGTYPAGGEDWGWRITLSLRPSGELVLQMSNVTPWGEEGRAVRMVCRRPAAPPR